MKLKPADGRAVRDPVKGELLPAEGAEIALDAFWRRRLRDGDVVEVTTDTASTTAASADASTTTSTKSSTASASTTASTASADTTTSTGASS